MFWLFTVLVALMVVLTVLCLVLFFIRHKPHKLPGPHHEARLLRERFSRGELSEDEFRKRMKELEQKPGLRKNG
ncbi:hypothetical protein KQ939_14015 [Planococcus sp. CP5-4]|uniref:hypothetical protein n=1 Tax=unclassified Planococcus (in: firmicutes) TaxID=2662419 RepID=UPI001C246FEC|nr:MULTISPECIES: hypothetical protein [unclassified Planococcus (in: firmicutes)]MBU9674051.1 hypothetical protein [Planococcus sp. CP5-4_YE]MBV0909922.1 hypothetical protein [Planococcus sp. CP5-4_UN]MBW6064802.1 hypothetical protein [Planococcus sp. CP5-4]